MEEKYLKNIKELIEEDIVLVKKNRLYENNHKLNTYFNIGSLIVEAQGGKARAKYGNELIKNWSKELTILYGKGYDYTNLSRMRKLYIAFRNIGSVPQELNWTILYILLPIKDESKRNYYINLCIKQNLSSRQLKSKIKSNEYERLEYKEDIKLLTEDKLTIHSMIKDPILIKADKDIDKLDEKALKLFILSKIEDFLLELGVGFTYVGSEVKLGKYRCDLLLFNYELNCFVVIELKTRKLIPQDIGQITHYINYIDTNMKKDYMNSTIGIILCKEGDNIVIKYTTDERILFTTYELSKN